MIKVFFYIKKLEVKLKFRQNNFLLFLVIFSIFVSGCSNEYPNVNPKNDNAYVLYPRAQASNLLFVYSEYYFKILKTGES